MQAFAQLFEPIRPTLVRVAAGIVGESDAEDVVMTALLKVWRALPGFKRQAALRTWIIKIVRNSALDAVRSRSRRREVPLEQEDDSEQSVTTDLPDPRAEQPGEALAASEEQTRVRQALEQMQEVHRQVLELRYMDDLSYSEIASALGISIGTVMSRLFYGKRKLAAMLASGRQEEGKEA